MPPGRGNVRVYIDGDATGLGRATKQAETHLGRLGSRVSGIGSKMTTAGAALNRGVTLPVVAIGAVAGKTAIDFDKSMRNVNSIAQLPEKNLKKLEQSVLNLAGPTAQAPKTLSEGLYDLVSSGFNAKESLGILDKSARAATAGLTTTEVSTAAVAAELNAYHLPAKKAGQISDQLFETVNRGVISFEDLATNIGDVLPFAASLGVGMDQVGASISTMTKEGISAPETMTRIKNVMVTLLKPGKDLSKVLDNLGVSGSELVKKKGFQGALETIIAQTDGTKESIGELFPNIRALGGVLALTGKNAHSAAADLSAFKDTSGATDRALSQQSKSLSYQWGKFRAELEETAIKAAPTFLSAGKSIIKDLGSMADKFNSLSPATKDMIIKGTLLAAALGPVLTISGNLFKVFGGILSISGRVSQAFTRIGTSATTANAAASAGAVGGVGPAASRMSTVRQTYGTYDLARSFGRGKAASALAQAGATASAGAMAAKSWAGSFATGLAPAVAAIGLGNILTSATSGDMKQAGFEAGGALAGGIAGAFIGGPAGAAIGAGVGSFVGGALSDLFDSERKLSPLQRQVRAEAEHVANALDIQGRAAQRLSMAQDRLSATNQRHKASTNRVKHAHDELNHAIKQFGPSSHQAYVAELQLARAQRKDAETARDAKDAHKMSNNELRLYRHRTVEAVAAEKQRIPNLQKMVNGLRKKSKEDKDNYRLLGRLVKKENDLSKAHGEVNRLIEQTNSRGMPKLAHWLESMTPKQARWGKHMQALVRELPNIGKASEQAIKTANRAIDIGGGAWVDYRGTVHQETAKALGDVKSFEGGTKTGFKMVEAALRASLTAMGVKAVDFGVGKARGGMMRVPGKGREDIVPVRGSGINAVVAPGEDLAVINRHQRPLLDAAVAGFFGVRGLSDFFNTYNKPHYLAKGGLVHPRMSGPDPMQDMGQHAIDRVWRRAKRYLRNAGGERSLQALVREGNRMDALKQPYLWGGGHGAMPSKSGPWDCSGGVSELFYGAGWKALRPMVSSGFESFGSPGAGRASILANAEHVYAVINGKAIGTSAENPGGGFGWISGYTYRPGFTVRHVDLAGEGVPRSQRTGRGQHLAKGYAKGGLAGLVGSSWDLDELATLAYVVGMDNPGLMAAVAWAESTGNAGAKNPNSTATGLWQVLGGSTDPFQNAKEAASLLKTQGLGAWAASQGTWAGAPKGSVNSGLARRLRALMGGESVDPDTIPVHGRTKLSYEEKISKLDTRIAKAETTATSKDDRRAAIAKLDLMRSRKRYLEGKVRGINKKLKGKLTPPKREQLLQQREGYLSELSSLPGEASGLIEGLREDGLNHEQLKKAARGFGIGVADPNGRITARDRADLQLARAESTPGKADDIKALERLVKVSEKELDTAKKSGDPRKLTEATRNLKEATDNLVAALPTAEDFANRDLALAELTEGTEDDRVALEKLRDLAQQQLDAALATADPRDDIEAAHNLKSVNDSLKSLTNTLEEVEAQKKQFAEERLAVDKRLADLAEAESPALMAALLAWVDGAIGGPVQSRGRLATAGVSAGYQ